MASTPPASPGGGAAVDAPPLTLLIGASGSIGQKLCGGLLDRFGDFSVVAAVRHTPLPPHLAARVHTVEGVDIRDAATLQSIFDAHPSIRAVWNLAAPLSVDTAKDPAQAHNITVGGMERLLQCCVRNGVRLDPPP
jgi:nucleoside-diphosphate-sugar epimerase